MSKLIGTVLAGLAATATVALATAATPALADTPAPTTKPSISEITISKTVDKPSNVLLR